MLHYFSNTFSGTATMTDNVSGVSTILTKKTGLLRYNYVVGYKVLSICAEGLYFDVYTLSCKRNLFHILFLAYTSAICQVSGDNNDNCLKCPSSNKYLTQLDTCVANCGTKYYGDDYLQQCRNCDSSCYTCNGKFYNNCTSCTGSLFLVPSKSICIPNCQDYNLTTWVSVPNMCGPCII